VIDYVLEISFPADPMIEEEVQALLFLSASSGSSSSERGVTAYFDTPESRAAAIEMLHDLRVELRVDDRERVDWLERYEQSLHPLFVGRSFVVAPDASLIPSGERPHHIVVPQELAFGTGSHESTSLCVEMLEGIDVRGKRGLDIGAGSGILSVAMLRLGASKVITFDNDVDAYGPLRENRARNGVSDDEMPLFIGSIESLRAGVFDVITMNILPEVIIPLLPQVIAHMNGDLILSGILNERRGDVVAAGSGLRLVEERSKGEWWCGRFQPPWSAAARRRL
jgi:ribosomal protein L11 methyltransferase